MGIRLRFCISNKLRGDADAGPWTHFKQQAHKTLVKSQSVYMSLFPFTIFFFFFKSATSYSSPTLYSLPVLLPEMFVVMSFKMLSGHFFQTYSLFIAGHIYSTQPSMIDWGPSVSELGLTALFLCVLLEFLARNLPTFLSNTLVLNIFPFAIKSQDFEKI